MQDIVITKAQRIQIERHMKKIEGFHRRVRLRYVLDHQQRAGDALRGIRDILLFSEARCTQEEAENGALQET